MAFNLDVIAGFLAPFLTAGCIFALFVGLILAITWVAGRKAEDLVGLVERGARLEVSTKPGVISLAIVVLVVFVGFVGLTLTEVRSLLAALFHFESEPTWHTQAITWVVVLLTVFADFVLIVACNRGRAQPD